MNNSLKKIIVNLLIIAMTFNNAGFITFAESVNEINTTTKNENIKREDLGVKYYNGASEKLISTLSSIDDEDTKKIVAEPEEDDNINDDIKNNSNDNSKNNINNNINNSNYYSNNNSNNVANNNVNNNINNDTKTDTNTNSNHYGNNNINNNIKTDSNKNSNTDANNNINSNINNDTKTDTNTDTNNNSNNNANNNINNHTTNDKILATKSYANDETDEIKSYDNVNFVASDSEIIDSANVNVSTNSTIINELVNGNSTYSDIIKNLAVASSSDFKANENIATDSEISSENENLLTNDDVVVDQTLFGDVSDSDKFEWKSSWYEDLGFTTAKSSITKIKFISDMGRFLQDSSSQKTPIDWVVIGQNGTSSTWLLSSKVLAMPQMNNGSSDIDSTFDTSDLVNWLNGSGFYDDAFTSAEKSYIRTTTVNPENNAQYGTSGGSARSMKVYVLSKGEVSSNVPSSYRSGNKTARIGGGTCNWWTRTPGKYLRSKLTISAGGGIPAPGSLGEKNISTDVGVRPTLWINLPAGLFDSSKTSGLTEVKKKSVNGRDVVNACIMSDGTLYIRLRVDYQKFNSNISNMFGETTRGKFTNLTSIEGLDLLNWSGPTNMSNMFKDCERLTSITFPSNFGRNATNMSSMFENCKAFSSLNLSNFVTTVASNINMSNMFKGCTNLSSLTLPSNFGSRTVNMEGMFERTKISAPPNNFNISAATNVKRLFANLNGINTFNNFQNLSFNTTNNVDATEMFAGNSSLVNINVNTLYMSLPSKVTTTTNMFNGCSNIKGNATTSYNTTHLDGEFARIDCGGLYPGYFKYTGTGVANLDFKKINWPTTAPKTKSQITNIKFYTDANIGSYDSCISLYQDSQNRKYYGYIEGNTLKIHWKNGYNLNLVADFSSGFEGFSGVTSIEGLDKLRSLYLTNISSLFKDCSELRSIDLSTWNVANVQNGFSNMFDGCNKIETINLPTSINTANATDLKNIFNNCENLTTLTNANIRIINATDVSNIFNNCKKLTSINLGDSTFANVNNAANMFKNCEELSTISVSTNVRGLNATAITSDMFSACTNLKGGANYPFDANKIDGEFARVDYGGIMPGYFTCTSPISVDLNFNKMTNLTSADKNSIDEIKFITGNDVGSVANKLSLYNDASGVSYYGYKEGTTLKIHWASAVNLKLPEDFSEGFKDFTNLKKITGFGNVITTNVRNFESLFENCSNIEEIEMGNILSSTQTPNVENVSKMFKNCSNLTTISVATNIRALPTTITNSSDMFLDCTNLKGGGGFKYDSNFVDGTYARVDYGGIVPGYFNCTDDNIYNSVNFTIDNTWTNNVTKADITKIKFTKSFIMEDFESSVNLNTTDATLNTKCYLKDAGHTLLIHFANQIGQLNTVADWTEFFSSFTNLVSIEGLEEVDTSNVTNMTRAFKDCAQLRVVDMGSFDADNVTSLDSTFENCTSLLGLIGNISTFSNLQTARNTFKNCTSLTVLQFDLAGIPTLTDVTGMFQGCTNLRTIYVNTNYQGLGTTTYTDMFDGCVNLRGGQGFQYEPADPNAGSGEFARVDYGGIMPGYFTITNPLIYQNATFNLPSNWFNSTTKNKSDIRKIKFYNDAAPTTGGSALGSYDEMFYMSNTDNTRAYIDGDTVKIHYGSLIPKLKVAGDWSGFFKDFTNLTTIEGLDTKIDTTDVTNMSELFSGCTSLTNITFNPNTPDVTNMSKIFYNCSSLSEVHIGTNLKLNKVENLESAFENCRDLTLFDIGVASFSNIRNLKNAFKNCESLTQFKFDVCSLDHLTTTEGMFSGCTNLQNVYVSDSFQGLPTTGLNSNDMFYNCLSLSGGQGFKYDPNYPITDGRVARVDYGGIMPGYYTIYGTPEQVRAKYEHAEFNLPAGWFDNAIAQGLSKDNVVKIKFYNDPVSGTNIGVGRYDGSYIMSTTENTVAYYENELDEHGTPTGNIIAKIHFGNLLPNLKVGSDFSGFFKDFRNMKSIEGLEKLNLSEVEDMSELFSGCENLQSITLTPDISHVREMDRIFYNCKNLTHVNIGVNVNLGNVETFESAFENCERLTAQGIDIRSTMALSHIRSFKNTFKNCKSLTAFAMFAENADTLETLEGMFSGCENLMMVNAQRINLTGVVSVKEMFANCKNLRMLVSGNYSNLATVSNLEKFFYNCENLTNLPPIHITSDRITTMKAMFASCSNITQVGILEAKTDNLVSDGLVDMFLNCKSLRSIAFGPEFVLGNATDLSNMFNGCENITILDLSSFKSNNIINVTNMFKNNHNLMTIIATRSFVVKNKIGNDMFLNCYNLVGGDGTKYSVASVNDSSYAQVDSLYGDPGYFSWDNPTLTFLPGDGGRGSMSPRTVARGARTNIKCEFRRSGYRFSNWIDEAGNTYGTTITPNYSMTLTAMWRKLPAPQEKVKFSSGPGGGGVGGGALIRNEERALNFILDTTINENEYSWINDDKGRRTGVLLKVDSVVGKALIDSDIAKGCYTLMSDGKTMQLAGGGLYKMSYMGSEQRFGFDKNGLLMTGFVQVSDATKTLEVSYNNYNSSMTNDKNEVFIERPSAQGKYYLNEEEGAFRGLLWNQPIKLNGVNYLFDIYGKVTTSIDFSIEQGIWEYIPTENKWKYIVPDGEGRARYSEDKIERINYNGKVNEYAFDKDGNLRTGYLTIDGKNYYAAEAGQNLGVLTELE